MTRAWLLAIVAIGVAIRVYGPWAVVFQPTHVNLLDSDAWYHLRAIEHLVRQFPHRLTFDPYAISGGQYVAVAPLFDVVVAAAAWVTGLGSPSAAHVVRVAAWAPPLMGAVTIVVVYAIARLRAGSLAALLAAALAAILPGHFLDRTLIGFVDHHALEALLAMAVLFLVARGLEDDAGWPRHGAAIGVALGAYLLAWTSAAFLTGILCAWLALHGVLAFWRGADPGNAGRILGVAAGVAMAIALVLQDRDLPRYQLQVIGVAALALVALAVDAGRAAVAARRLSGRSLVLSLLATAVVVLAAATVAFPSLAAALAGDLARFSPSTGRMQVLEARPLFLFDGLWSLRPAWLIFRSGFAVGLVALAVIAVCWARGKKPIDLLLLVWGVAMYLATIGQNRFGYYLVPIAAVAAGCVSAWAIEAGRRRGGWRRDAAVVAVAALVFGPNLVPAIWTTGRPAGLPAEWLPAFEWLRTRTPEPFGDPEYYYARYTDPVRAASFNVLAWWDYGYWVSQIARRVPTANPTQAGAPETAAFFVETDDARAGAMLAAARARYVLVDDLLPFQVGPAGITGKFESLVTWSGADGARFYDVFLVPQGAGYQGVTLFHPAYYESMAFRLGVLGGEASRAAGPSVVSWTTAVLPGVDRPQKIVTALRDFASETDARAYLQSLGPGPHALVGRHPERSPVDLAAVRAARRTYRTPAAGAFRHGAVQVFEAVVW